MKLYLVQHGEAKTAAEDPERPLTERGAEDAERVARWAAGAGVRVDEIRHSGKRRAEQTAEIMAAALKPARGVAVGEGLNPTADVGPIAQALGREDGPVMIVGHMPFLVRLAGLLVVDDRDAAVVRFRRGGIVSLSDEPDGWRVEWAVTPDLVRAT